MFKGCQSWNTLITKRPSLTISSRMRMRTPLTVALNAIRTILHNKMQWLWGIMLTVQVLLRKMNSLCRQISEPNSLARPLIQVLQWDLDLKVTRCLMELKELQKMMIVMIHVQQQWNRTWWQGGVMVQVLLTPNKIQVLQTLLLPRVPHKTHELLAVRISRVQSRTAGMISVFVKVQVKNVMVRLVVRARDPYSMIYRLGHLQSVEQIQGQQCHLELLVRWTMLHLFNEEQRLYLYNPLANSSSNGSVLQVGRSSQIKLLDSTMILALRHAATIRVVASQVSQ